MKRCENCSKLVKDSEFPYPDAKFCWRCHEKFAREREVVEAWVAEQRANEPSKIWRRPDRDDPNRVMWSTREGHNQLRREAKRVRDREARAKLVKEHPVVTPHQHDLMGKYTMNKRWIAEELKQARNHKDRDVELMLIKQREELEEWARRENVHEFQKRWDAIVEERQRRKDERKPKSNR